jgi:hypothetical protein
METVIDKCHIFSEGTTITDKTIEIEADGVLQGAGSRLSTIHSTANPIVRVQNNSYQFGKNAMLENIIIEGDNSTTAQIAIELNDVNRCYITNITIKDVDIGTRIRANTNNSSADNFIENVQMVNVNKGVQFYNNGSGNFQSTNLNNVSISLSGQQNLVGIEIGTDCILSGLSMHANVISTENCVGMYIDGTVNAESISFSHKKNSITSGGYSVSLGQHAIVNDENGQFYVGSENLTATLHNPHSIANRIIQ